MDFYDLAYYMTLIVDYYDLTSLITLFVEYHYLTFQMNLYLLPITILSEYYHNWMEQKGITFDHDFCYFISFSLPSLFRREEKIRMK